MAEFVGGNPAPGTFFPDKITLGAHAYKPESGAVIEDVSARNLWGDVIYVGPSGKVAKENVTMRRVVGHDAGRHFMSVVNGRTIVVEDWTAANMALSVLDTEPQDSDDVATNVTMRRGYANGASHFVNAAKGIGARPVSVTWEDVVAEDVGNALWAHAPYSADGPLRYFTFRRCHFRVRGDASDRARFRDSLGVTVTPWSNPDVPFFAPNCAVTLENVWVNGRPVTAADIKVTYINSAGQSESCSPTVKIFHTGGWTPDQIAAPRLEVTPPPPPPDLRDAEIARLDAEVARLVAELAASEARADAIAAELLLVRERAVTAEGLVAAVRAVLGV